VRRAPWNDASSPGLKGHLNRANTLLSTILNATKIRGFNGGIGVLKVDGKEGYTYINFPIQ
jgi:hypothetical protein